MDENRVIYPGIGCDTNCRRVRAKIGAVANCRVNRNKNATSWQISSRIWHCTGSNSVAQNGSSASLGVSGGSRLLTQVQGLFEHLFPHHPSRAGLNESPAVRLTAEMSDEEEEYDYEEDDEEEEEDYK